MIAGQIEGDAHVIRRVGGLEDVRHAHGKGGAVIRRVGGLEVIF